MMSIREVSADGAAPEAAALNRHGPAPRPGTRRRAGTRRARRQAGGTAPPSAASAAARSRAARLSNQVSTQRGRHRHRQPPQPWSGAPPRLPPASTDGSTASPASCSHAEGVDHAQHRAEQPQQRRHLRDAVRAAGTRVPPRPAAPRPSRSGAASARTSPSTAARRIGARWLFGCHSAAARASPCAPASQAASARSIPPCRPTPSAVVLPELEQDDRQHQHRQEQQQRDDRPPKLDQRGEAGGDQVEGHQPITSTSERLFRAKRAAANPARPPHSDTPLNQHATKGGAVEPRNVELPHARDAGRQCAEVEQRSGARPVLRCRYQHGFERQGLQTRVRLRSRPCKVRRQAPVQRIDPVQLQRQGWRRIRLRQRRGGKDETGKGANLGQAPWSTPGSRKASGLGLAPERAFCAENAGRYGARPS